MAEDPGVVLHGFSVGQRYGEWDALPVDGQGWADRRHSLRVSPIGWIFRWLRRAWQS